MMFMICFLRRLVRDVAGGPATEYALLLMLVAPAHADTRHANTARFQPNSMSATARRLQALYVLDQRDRHHALYRD